MKIIIIFVILISGCARSSLKSSNQVMRKIDNFDKVLIEDDLGYPSLLVALEENIKFISEKLPSDHIFYFGPREISKDKYVSALNDLLVDGKNDLSGEKFKQKLKSKFEAYEVYGTENWGQVFITSYFEPVIMGSKKPDKKYSKPIYGTPKDLVAIDLDSFIPIKPELEEILNKPMEQRSKKNILRGRIYKDDRSGASSVSAYFSRADVDEKGLKKEAEVLAWVDPVDAFFLEIQGSGVVKFKNGQEIHVGYAAQNGHPYVAIGKFMPSTIPKDKVSMQVIESYLRSLPEVDAKKLMQMNPSYVFFQKVDKAGVTFLGSKVINGRTIATDKSLFPKGALAYLTFDKPIFDSKEADEPSSFLKSSRFVLDQDTGGAIRGPGRVDLFWGRGDEAKQVAGVMKSQGRLVYFVPIEN